ncbi:MAG: hypothetical protein KAR47_07835, partial [Planctomycetes bacterium]|nr:hypothetical protein [Planctomycetota bacterium]
MYQKWRFDKMGDARSRFANILITLTAAMVLFSVGCRKPGSPDESAESGYDPRTDPLVNPPSMFEPPPEDILQIANNETLFLQLDGSPNTLNPLFVSSMYEFTVVDVLYAALFTFDKDMKWMVNDDLTESIEESADHTSFI